VPVNNTLNPVWNPTQSFKMHQSGYNIILVDTPGFEETGLDSPESVLKQVVKWVKKKYCTSSLTMLWTN